MVAFPNHVGWGDFRFSEVYFICTFAHHHHSFTWFYISVGVLVPFFITGAAYVAIFSRVRKSKLVRARILGQTSLHETEAQQTHTTKRMKLREFHRNVRMAQALFRVYVIFLGMVLPIAVLFLLGRGRQIDFVWYILALLLSHGNNSVNCIVYAFSLDHFRNGYAKLLGLSILRKKFQSRKNRNVDELQDLAVRRLPLAASAKVPAHPSSVDTTKLKSGDLF